MGHRVFGAGPDESGEERCGWTAFLAGAVGGDAALRFGLRGDCGMRNDAREDGPRCVERPVRMRCRRNGLCAVRAALRNAGRIEAGAVRGGCAAHVHVRQHAVMLAIAAAACRAAEIVSRREREERRDRGQAHEDRDQDGEETSHESIVATRPYFGLGGSAFFISRS